MTSRLGALRISASESNSGAGHVAAGLLDQVDDQHIQHALESFVEDQFFVGLRELLLHGSVEALEDADMLADMVKGENAGFHAVVKIGGEVGDLVGEIDELRFERRPLVEEIFG